MATEQKTEPAAAKSVLARIKVGDLHSDDGLDHATSDPQYYTSYNIVDGPIPGVIIPGKRSPNSTSNPEGTDHEADNRTGCPAKWTPDRHFTQKLSKDAGTFYRDDNAARFPVYPSKPAVLAVFDQHPDVKTDEIDVVACGNTLGKCLDFALSHPPSEFQFRGQLVGRTLFIVRTEASPTAIIPDVYGYGHTFLERNTQWDGEVKNSVSHQRIVRYEFGGLTYLVRTESDGYLPDKLLGSPAARSHASADLQAMMGDTSLGPKPSTHKKLDLSADSGDTIPISRSSTQIPQAAIFDLKTRSAYSGKLIDMETMRPRLWLSRTPNFIVAYHRSGFFKKADIHVSDERAGLKQWEHDNSTALSRFGALIRRLREAAAAVEHGKIEVRVTSEAVDVLEIRECPDLEWEALPASLRERWADGIAPTRSDTEIAEDRDAGGEAEGEGEGAITSASAVLHPDEEEEGFGYADNFYDDDDFEGGGYQSDNSTQRDYTACSAEDCGYCGQCSY